MKTRTVLLWALWVVLAAVPRCGAAGDGAPPIQNAVLVSWDGASRDVLKELLAADKLPALAALIKEGSLQEIEVKGHRTSTMPSHATMLTGYLSDVHKIASNDLVKPIPEGLTVFERLEQCLGTNAIQTIMVAGKRRNLGGATPDDVYGLARRHMDCFDSTNRLAASVVDIALPVWERLKSPRFFLFLHFVDPDMAGHGMGKASPNYREAIVACDTELARVIEVLKNAKLYDSTRVYVTADHGMDDQGREHKNAPNVFLATNDKAVIRGGILADVPATILARMGVDIGALKPPLAGQTLTASPRQTEAPPPQSGNTATTGE